MKATQRKSAARNGPRGPGDEAGGRPGAGQVILHDISQRKQAEAAVRYRLDFERLLAMLSTTFINLSPADTATGVNSALQAIGAFVGVDRSYILLFGDNDTMRIGYEWCAEGAKPVMHEFQNVPTGNYPQWLERRKRLETIHIPRVDELAAETEGKDFLQGLGVQSFLEVPMVVDGSLVGALGMWAHTDRVWPEDDITLLKMAGDMLANALQRQAGEQERADLEDKLRQSQRLKAVGRLASGVAHNFNNQLAVIKGCAQFLLAGLKEDDPLRKDAERINATVNRGAQLVRQLLTFSSKQPSHPELLNLNHLVEETAPVLRALLGEQTQLQLHAAAGLWLVRADPAHLEQVIMNLVINACDAIEAAARSRAATVTLETANIDRHAAARALAGESVGHGGYVMLAVSDTGCGMTAEVRQRIFEPFFTTKERGKGTGLGLSTAFGTVKQHGGYITCASEPGRGTTLSIYLPRARSGTNTE